MFWRYSTDQAESCHTSCSTCHADDETDERRHLELNTYSPQAQKHTVLTAVATYVFSSLQPILKLREELHITACFSRVCLSVRNTSYLKNCRPYFDVTLGKCCIPKLHFKISRIAQMVSLEQQLRLYLLIRRHRQADTHFLPSLPLLICTIQRSVWTLPIM